MFWYSRIPRLSRTESQSSVQGILRCIIDLELKKQNTVLWSDLADIFLIIYNLKKVQCAL